MKHNIKSTIIKIIQLCAFCTLIFSCEDRLFDNIYDVQYQLPQPTNLTLEQISDNEIQLNWNNPSTEVDGFIIDKILDDGNWQTQYIVINKNQTSCIDTEIVYDKSHTYRVSAFADENISTTSFQKTIIPYYIAPLAFEDDFSLNSLNWQIASGNWHLSNNALLIDGPNDDYQHLLIKETSNHFSQPIRFIVNADHISGDDEISIFGIGFIDTINENKIIYLINPDGWYSLSEHNYATNEWSSLIDWQESDFISEDLVLLEIIYRDGFLKLYYNGHYLNSYQLSNLSLKGIMLYHQGADKIEFDNVGFYAHDIGTISKTISVTIPHKDNNTLNIFKN